MYNIGAPDVIGLTADEAIVVYRQAVEASWPLNELNQALALFYNNQSGIPQIYPVGYNGRAVGYLVMSRSDAMSAAERTKLFWDVMNANDLVTQDANGFRFSVGDPLVTNADINGVWAAAVGYVQPFGVNLPATAINMAIWTLMNASSWPASNVVFLYGVQRHTESKTFGLWVADQLDDMLENTEMDDAMFIRVRNCNTKEAITAHPDYAPRRVSS